MKIKQIATGPHGDLYLLTEDGEIYIGGLVDEGTKSIRHEFIKIEFKLLS